MERNTNSEESSSHPKDNRSPEELDFSFATFDLEMDMLRCSAALDIAVEFDLAEQMKQMNIKESTDEQKGTDSQPAGQETTRNKKPSRRNDYFRIIDGSSELHRSITDCRKDDAMRIIKSAPHRSYLDITNALSMTPLHLAVKSNQIEVVRLLVCSGADTSLLDNYGSSALHLAVDLGDIRCVKALTEPITEDEIADLETKPVSLFFPSSTVNLYDSEGYTALHIATMNCQFEIVKYLGEKLHANMNIKELKLGCTCLHLASSAWHSEALIELLLDLGADPTEKNYSGHDLYRLAVEKRLFYVQLLLRQLEEPDEVYGFYDAEDAGYHSGEFLISGPIPTEVIHSEGYFPGLGWKN